MKFDSGIIFLLALMGLCMICLFVQLLIFQLLLFHIFLRCKGLTTYEFIQKKRKKKSSRRVRDIGRKGTNRAATEKFKPNNGELNFNQEVAFRRENEESAEDLNELEKWGEKRFSKSKPGEKGEDKLENSMVLRKGNEISEPGLDVLGNTFGDFKAEIEKIGK